MSSITAFRSCAGSGGTPRIPYVSAVRMDARSVIVFVVPCIQGTARWNIGLASGVMVLSRIDAGQGARARSILSRPAELMTILDKGAYIDDTAHTAAC